MPPQATCWPSYSRKLGITSEVGRSRLAGPSCHYPCGPQRAQRDVLGRVQWDGIWHIHLYMRCALHAAVRCGIFSSRARGLLSF